MKIAIMLGRSIIAHTVTRGPRMKQEKELISSLVPVLATGLTTSFFIGGTMQSRACSSAELIGAVIFTLAGAWAVRRKEPWSMNVKLAALLVALVQLVAAGMALFAITFTHGATHLHLVTSFAGGAIFAQCTSVMVLILELFDLA
jgi:hypothetical protein